MKTIELYYPMIQFLIISDTLHSKCRSCKHEKHCLPDDDEELDTDRIASMPWTNLICSGGRTTPDMMSGFHSLPSDKWSIKQEKCTCWETEGIGWRGGI